MRVHRTVLDGVGWEPLQRIAAILLGPDAAPPPANISPTIAGMALSPGIHDPTTAMACIDQLGALMVRLARRRIEGPFRFHEGTLRVIAEGAGYADMMALSFAAITHHADDHIDVYARLLDTLEGIAAATPDRERRAAIAARIDDLLQRAARADVPRRARVSLLRRGRSLHRELRDGSQAV